jgi:hypothetical protein
VADDEGANLSCDFRFSCTDSYPTFGLFCR